MLKNKLIFVTFFIITMGINICALIALLYFNAHDNSFFFYNTAAAATYNPLGFLGAYTASLLYYFFGSGASFVVFSSIVVIVLVVGNYFSGREFFVLLLSSVMLLLLLALLSLYGYTQEGGRIGYLVMHKLYALCGDKKSVFFLWMSVVASCIALFYYVYVAYVSLFFEKTIQKSKVEHFVPFAYKDVEPVQEYKKSVEAEEDLYQDDVLQEVVDADQLSCPKNVSVYKMPSMTIFVEKHNNIVDKNMAVELKENAVALQEKLECFGIKGSVIEVRQGPVVTLFEYQPEIGSKISKITALEDDLALALSAMSIRIIAPIPGRSVVGFEIANKNRKNVFLSNIIKSTTYSEFQGALPLILGSGTIGQNSVVDLARMPHLLIAGSTGSGKSVALNAILVSLLCKCSPDDLQLILVDPKRLEFAPYADIAHLLFPIVVDAVKVTPVLKWVVDEMERRYQQMAECGTRNIFDYQQLQLKNKQLQKMAFIVVVIDELSDLMMLASKEIEILITRIAQKARAAGIHMIIATQRPSVDVITGLIKVNFPSRISFRVVSKTDSRTILDSNGAEKLLGQGDMLFLNSGQAIPQRIHGAYVTDDEIVQVVQHIKKQRPVAYLQIEDEMRSQGYDVQEDDFLYGDIKKYLQEVDEISISQLQRYFRIGYNRSARIIERLESEGAILPAQGGKMRKVVR